MEEKIDFREQRIAKVEKLKEKGIEPYGRKFERSAVIKDLIENFEEGKSVKVAGRIMAIRSHGKSAFADVEDATGKIQFYVKKDAIGENNYEIFQLLDIGDFIGLEGTLFKTRMGEITIQAAGFTPLSKALLPLPEKWHGLKDTEVRYRQRYLDLIANKSVREVLGKRSFIINKVRGFFNTRGFLEVETPVLQAIPGGAAGRPFKTHHNEFDCDLYLRIAPELYLKKLLVGGFEKVYEMGKNFRNEGISTRHNPEFTMLEVYQAYADYNDMMDLIEELFVFLAKELFGTEEIEYQGKKISFKRPFKRISFAKALGLDPAEKDLKRWKEILKEKFDVDIEEGVSRSQIVRVAEDMLNPEGEDSFQPAFIVDYFTELSPLAKTKKDNPALIERFELFTGGMEVANAYSELNDPAEQKRRFIEQEKEEKHEVKDEDFVRALEYGMPPAGGLGIGIDRLVMLFTNQSSIRDVVLFPQLKPVKEGE
ncbi:MAG: lysine--tRNA ligase [Candidatus Omnitrophota bacterium]